MIEPDSTLTITIFQMVTLGFFLRLGWEAMDFILDFVGFFILGLRKSLRRGK